MTTDRPAGIPPEPTENRKSDLPRQTLPAMTAGVQISERPAVVKTISGRSVAVLQVGGEERVEIRSASGEMMLSVRLTDQGPVFSLAGASFEIAAAKSLSLSAETIEVKARGDVTIEAGRTLRAGGRDVDVIAEPGQVAIRANDDVDITGERVRLNSDDPPMPQSIDEHRARRAVSYDPFSAPLSPARLDTVSDDPRGGRGIDSSD